MNINILIYSLAFSCIAFAIYKIYKRRSFNSKMDQSLSEMDLKPYYNSLNLDFEEKVRKQWLTLFYAISGFGLINSIFNFYSGETFLEVSEKYGAVLPLIMGIMFFVLLTIPFIWITYYCAYKKRGTAFLMFLIATTPLGELANIGFNLWYHASVWNMMQWVIFGVGFGLDMLLLVASIRLWKVNTARKQQKLLAYKAKYAAANGLS